jgi:hypothetical protein
MTTDEEASAIAWPRTGATWSFRDPERIKASFGLIASVSRQRPLAELLALVATNARGMARANLAFIALPLDANILRVETAVGVDSERIHGLTVRRGRSMIGRAFAGRRPVSARIADDQALSALPSGPALLLPLDTGEVARGVLGVVGRPGDLPPSASVTRSLALFAALAATMIELSEERQEVAHTEWYG